MFGSIYLKSLWETRRSTIIWSISMAALMIMMVLLYPSIGESGGYADIAEELPDSMKAFIGEFGDITTPEGFLGVEMYSLMVPIMLMIVAIGRGASAIGKEEDSGTLELLLASPLSRSKILLEKTLAMITGVMLIGASAIVGIYIGAIFVDFDISFSALFWATFVASLLAVVFGLIALLITVVRSGRGAAVGVSTGIFIVSYFMNTLPTVVSWLEPVQPFSLNNYGDAQAVLLNGVEYAHIAILLSIAIVLYLIASPFFSHRDTGV